ncbi:MAG TPA: hypothetical protein VEH00_10470 [Steroidobacteraceae bacterium]|nr:hypothetical protein [Steroidobacteraceae bacterium]
MDYSVEEIQPNVWRVSIGTVTRIVRFRSDDMTFAPWDVTSADGQTLWSASSLASAFRWIQARTGYPVEALFAQALLERSADSQQGRGRAADESAETGEDSQALSG